MLPRFQLIALFVLPKAVKATTPTNGAKSFAQSQSSDSIDFPICSYVSGTINIRKSFITCFLNLSEALPMNSPVAPLFFSLVKVTFRYSRFPSTVPDIVIMPLL